MKILKSFFILFLLLFVNNIYANESWEFDPQSSTAQLETNHIWFQDNSSNQIGPEIYADDTNTNFFTFIKDAINSAITNNNKIILQFTNINSENHGQYDCIIPES